MSDGDLSALFPRGVKIQLGGREIELLPLSIGEYAAVLPSVEALLAVCAPYSDAIKSMEEFIDILLPRLLILNQEALKAVVCAFTRLDGGFVAGLSATEIIVLISQILKINADFFLLLKGMLAALKAPSSPGGGPSSDSSPPGTPSTT